MDPPKESKQAALETILAGLQPVSSFRGEVIDVNEHEVTIAFKSEGSEFARIFPRERLDAIRASFPRAEVQYDVYAIGRYSVSNFQYIGPSREELLARPLKHLSDRQIANLQHD